MHPSHDKELKKLNRICGQLEGIKKMIEQRKYCVEIMTQTRAARNALKSVELAILETHMKSCLENTVAKPDSQPNKIDEILALLKKYE